VARSFGDVTVVPHRKFLSGAGAGALVTPPARFIECPHILRGVDEYYANPHLRSSRAVDVILYAEVMCAQARPAGVRIERDGPINGQRPSGAGLQYIHARTLASTLQTQPRIRVSQSKMHELPLVVPKWVPAELGRGSETMKASVPWEVLTVQPAP